MPTQSAAAASSADFNRDIYSVARLTSEVRAVLDGSFPLLWVRGEISNLAQPASGHIYFSLKDEAAQVRCAMFRSKRILLPFRPENGQQVLVRVRVTLYEPRGDFQLVVEHMEPGGEGALRLAFEQLKQKLAREGLFDEATKQPTPSFPRQVGVITSPSGAAVRDVLTVLGRRFAALPVIIYPAQVQGEAAPAALIAALEIANLRAECDVLILARGGGSLEDMSAFNDEGLARAIRASKIPVVSGVGHEIDITIADLAADRRAATPSAAAELVAPSAEHLRQGVLALSARLMGAQQRKLAGSRQRLTAVTRHLALLHPSARLQQQAQRLDRAELRLRALIAERVARSRRRLQPLMDRLAASSPDRRIERAQLSLASLQLRLSRSQKELLAHRRERLLRAVAGLDARSPLGTLTRGYAIVTKLPEGEIVRDSAQVAPGDRVRARVAGGTFEAVVREDEGQ
ncbi:exodeoxyribonuclease VII large subunit [Thiorhodococcus mannitoliphagus]|uniref:Exodeoxyribonuclease 7 large subunit n=1 Tax=Thiorhodococcus mannitoliphagus TaxID=329406 RepID=A0A6P1E5S1_9GAMM|nr:exodeoxyribonuclease VII large subunit [Thiorhodococcus mannitoliphagus]NEX22925.1 exodeoxyribonuclease VII large subunit [Thiorhodococcus mannitoliphagus]